MADDNQSDLNDIATSLGQAGAAAAKQFDQIQDSLLGTVDSTKEWQKMLAAAVVHFKDLPGHISTSKELWEEMTKNSELANKIQKEMTSDLQKHLPDRKDLVKIVEDHVAFAERIQKHQEDTNVAMLDANKLMKDLGSLIRNPAQGMDMVLGKMGQLPQKIADATQETGSLTKGLGKVAGDGIGKLIGPVKKLFAAGGLFLVGIAAVTLAFTGLFMLVKNYYNWVDKEVMPAQAKFNKEIGNTGEGVAKLKGQMSSVGAEFQLLGYSFEEGAALVRGFAKSFKEVDIDKKELTLAKDLIAVVGMTAEEAGSMALQFKKQSGNVEAMEAAFTAAEKGAKAYGLPVNDVLRDLGQAPDVLARFGTKNALAFAEATAKANSYGLSIKDVNKSFGDQFDAFEKTAEAGANLNAIFGTNINSLELMMETDPTKRMEMVRKQLVANGKEWENLSNFEKNVIAENLGVEKSQAALILSSEKERKKLEQKARAQKAVEKTQAQWNKGIHQIKKTLIAWGAELDNVMRSTTDFIFAILGFKKPGKEMSSITNLMTKGFRSLGSTIKDWTAQMRGEKATTSGFIETLKGIKIAAKWVYDVFKSISNIFTEVSEKIENLTGGFVKMKDLAVEGAVGAANALSGGMFGTMTKGLGAAVEGFKALGKEPVVPKSSASAAPVKLRNQTRINERSQRRTPRDAPGGSGHVKVVTTGVYLDGKLVGKQVAKSMTQNSVD